jgi:hypothetical protein
MMKTEPSPKANMMNHQAKRGVVMAQQEQYQEPKTITFPGMTVRVYRPILTAEERARRMAQLHNQAAQLLKGVKHNE